MAMSRQKKEVELEAYKARFEENETIIVTQYSGLSVSQMTDLRARLRESGASFKVTKNSLAQRALEGTRFEGIKDLFKGPVGIATSQDPVAAAKVAYEYSKENEKLVLIGGAYGERVLDPQGVEALAKMPSIDEVRATIVMLINSPASKLAGAIKAPAGKIAGAVKTISEKAE
jgi:large subunit ribosomal protein L10